MKKVTKQAAKVERSYGLSASEIVELRKQAKEQKVHPIYLAYRGCYGSIIAALLKLGANKPHTFKAILAGVKSDFGPGPWKEFASKKGENDAEHRVATNISVLQRRKDYGLKLVNLGCSLETVKKGDEKMYQLNTK